MSPTLLQNHHLPFWPALETLIASHKIKIDRPQGSIHPRYPEIVYALDYGYLEGTTSTDGSDINVWIGGMQDRSLRAVVLTVDLDKSNSEIKVLLGCTTEELQMILGFHDRGRQSAILIERDGESS